MNRESTESECLRDILEARDARLRDLSRVLEAKDAEIDALNKRIAGLEAFIRYFAGRSLKMHLSDTAKRLLSKLTGLTQSRESTPCISSRDCHS